MTTNYYYDLNEVEAPHVNEMNNETDRISPCYKDVTGMKKINVNLDEFCDCKIKRKYINLNYEGKKIKIKKQSIEKILDVSNISNRMWSVIDTVDDSIDTWDDFKSLPSFKVLKRIMEYIIVGTPVGEWKFVKDLGYDEIAQTMIKRKLFSGPNMFVNIIRMIKYVSSSLKRYKESGEMIDLFHSGRSYQRWYVTAMNVKRLAPYLANLEPHGMNIFSFIRDLNECLDQGASIYKSVKINKYDDRVVSQILGDLRTIKANFMTKSASMKERRAPMAFLVYGKTGVAKSQFTKLLYTHYANTFDLPCEDNYRYVRLAIDKHWNNFGSHMWCVQLDDIAFMHPNKAMAGDPSVMEILQIINNVPFVPTQAAIEDKGKTPMFAKLVIGTTNTPHLNAQYYFSNHYAVRRRFPYIINIVPKDELRKGDMIDTSKIPEINDEYPDFWIITVKKISVVSSNDEPLVSEEVIKVFNNIYEFLAWYSQVCIEHESIQDRSQRCESAYKNITLCKLCYYPTTRCICNLINQTSDALCNRSGWKQIINAIMGAYIFCWLDKVLPSIITNKLRYIVFNSLESKYQETYFYKLGETIREYKISKEMKLAFITTIILVVIYLFYRIWKPSEIIKKETDDGCIPLNEKDETNFYKNRYEVTSFDQPLASCSTSNLSKDEFIKRIERNCIVLEARHTCSKTQMTLVRENKAFCVRGNLYVVNTHFLANMDKPKFKIIQGITQNIDGNMLYEGNFKILKVIGDTTILRIDCIPPKKDLTAYLPKNSYRGCFSGFYISREIDGSILINDFHSVKRGPTPEGLDAIFAITKLRTKLGSCGSLSVMKTTSGYVIAGIHGAAMQDVEDSEKATYSIAVAYPVTKDIIDSVEFSPAQGTMVVETDSIILSNELHKKSPLCNINGTAYIFGSLKGYVSKTHSRVQSTPISDDVKLYLNKEDTHGAPIMSGNKPWEIALNPTLNPSNKIDVTILDQVVKDFTNDILSSLHKNELDLIRPYSWDIVVNGKEGVQYVDKINTSSSMGWPWNKSKKFFLKPDIQSNQQHGVTFPDDIWERVDNIETSYRKGELVHPVFRTNLKDEPVTLKKINNEKTRIFTSCPIDWCLVVRKWILPIIRVIQRNRFIFEAQPGIVAQSSDWEELYDYLISKGPNYFAGDYENYDKRLPPSLMKAGYQIMINLALAAGQVEMANMITCICSDSIYPFMVYKSEVIQAFGSLPSGVPVTAILNSLVGSIIMRYAYAVLKKENGGMLNATDFKKHVALVTYGDDNAAGVSDKVKWFNHCNVSRVLTDQLDLKYTMAEKDAMSIPFIPINEVSFLKRKFVFNSEFKCIVGPLDETSLFKMLTKWIPSKTVDSEIQIESVITSCVRESVFHGREVFNMYTNMLKKIVYDKGIPIRHDMVFPKFEFLVAAFLKSSNNRSNYKRILKRHDNFMRSMINDRSIEYYTNFDPRECDLDDDTSISTYYAASSNLPERSSKLFFNKVSADTQLDKPLSPSSL